MGNEDANSPDLTVYYDGACPLCSVEIGYYEACKGGDRIDFVDVSSHETPIDLDRDQALARFHVRQVDGTLLSGARAFIAVWDTLPNWRWAARIAKIPGVPTLMEGGYRLFLYLRPALSRLARRLGAKARTPT